MGVPPLAVLDSFRLQATGKIAQAARNERAMELRARLFEIDMLGSKIDSVKVFYTATESAAHAPTSGPLKELAKISASAGRAAAKGSSRINCLRLNPWERGHLRPQKEPVCLAPDTLRLPNGRGRPFCSAQNRMDEKDCLSARQVYRRLGTS